MRTKRQEAEVNILPADPKLDGFYGHIAAGC